MKKKSTEKEKTGKLPSPHPVSKAKIEEDPDELVHSDDIEEANEGNEVDPDDLLHRPGKTKPASLNKSGMEDPDDLIHRSTEQTEE